MRTSPPTEPLTPDKFDVAQQSRQALPTRPKARPQRRALSAPCRWCSLPARPRLSCSGWDCGAKMPCSSQRSFQSALLVDCVRFQLSSYLPTVKHILVARNSVVFALEKVANTNIRKKIIKQLCVLLAWLNPWRYYLFSAHFLCALLLGENKNEKTKNWNIHVFIVFV